MADAPHSRLEQLNWAAIEPKASDVPEDLRQALRSILKEDDKLLTATYPYGDPIVSNGILQLPAGAKDQDESLLEHHRGEKRPPLCLVLSGCVEVYLEVLNVKNTFPLQLISPGEMFGVFEALDRLYNVEDSPGSYSVSSGARSIWILGARLKGEQLPKKVGQRLGLSDTSRWWKHESDPHYKFVKKATKLLPPWYCEIVFLHDSFVKAATENRTFEQLLYSLGWKQSAHARRQISSYNENENIQKQKSDYYLLMQHLNSVQLGQLPAFCVSHLLPRVAGPFEAFQKALYGVLVEEAPKGKTAHFPFILQPAQLQKTGDAGFYSFKEPQPYLEPDKKPAKDQCAYVKDLVGSHREHFYFFCNGADGKPYAKDKHPLGSDHYDLNLSDFVDSAAASPGFPPGGLTKEQICLADGFLNTGVMIRR
jgi:hypothetical protein